MTLICGIDEAGRGPLCGPVFASAVILDSNDEHLNNLADSKKLSEKNRISIYEQIKLKAVDFSFANASVEEIDRINILQASLLAMKRAFELLKIKPDCIIFLGDSNSVASSISLKKEGYKIAHIEAGMRSYDKRMLEEINRTICDHCSDLNFVYNKFLLEKYLATQKEPQFYFQDVGEQMSMNIEDPINLD